MKNKLIFQESNLTRARQKRITEIPSETPDDFGFFVMDDKTGEEIWPGFRVYSETGKIIRPNYIDLIPIGKYNFYFVNGVYREENHLVFRSKSIDLPSSISHNFEDTNKSFLVVFCYDGKKTLNYGFFLHIPSHKLRVKEDN